MYINSLYQMTENNQKALQEMNDFLDHIDYISGKKFKELDSSLNIIEINKLV